MMHVPHRQPHHVAQATLTCARLLVGGIMFHSFKTKQHCFSLGSKYDGTTGKERVTVMISPSFRVGGPLKDTLILNQALNFHPTKGRPF